jgi:hypothetical protein
MHVTLSECNPSLVEEINMNGFNGCRSLEEIVFSFHSHLREIYEFWKSTSLCRIEIPSSVEVIGYDGFNACTSIRVIINRAGWRMRGDEALCRIKPLLVYEENDLREGGSLIHLGFARG